MSSSKGAGNPETSVPMLVLTFLVGCGLFPLAWWQGDALIVSLAALLPFVLYLRSAG